jgi:hypothetical protein
LKRLNPYKVWITVGTLKGVLDPDGAIKGNKPILKRKDKRGGYYG